MNNRKYLILFSIVFVVIVADQWTKVLAQRYLRSPSDSDFRKEHYASCQKAQKRCKKLCKAQTLQRAGSRLACERSCKRQNDRCRDALKPAYKQAKELWNDQIKSLQSSLLCRKVLYPTSARPECVVVPNYFHFTYRTNTGAAWGIFSSLEDRIRRPFFICITLIAIFFIFYLFAFRLEPEHLLMIVALALILGGALGNFMDRLRLDYVIDFIEWFWRNRQKYTWPTFNIADVAISVGVVLIAFELFFFAPPEEEFEDEEAFKDTFEPMPEPQSAGNELAPADVGVSKEESAEAQNPAAAATSDEPPQPEEPPSEGGAQDPAQDPARSEQTQDASTAQSPREEPPAEASKEPLQAEPKPEPPEDNT